MSKNDVDPDREYSTTQAGEILNLTNRHVQRLVDAGYFPGARRKSPVPQSPRVIPGSAILEFLAQREVK